LQKLWQGLFKPRARQVVKTNFSHETRHTQPWLIYS
jgi:hypothetical protein